MKKNHDQFGRIGVLMGGYSSERDISLKSGKAVCEALQRLGCQVMPLDIVDKKEDKILSFILDAHIDIAFIALHGELGEDGQIQSILEKINIPYTGSGVEASRLAINKVLTQNLFKNNGIAVPQYVILSKQGKMDVDSIISKLDFFPIVTKPACGGSSIGINIVNRKEELEKALKFAWQYGDQILLERYIQGRELTVGILDKKPLPVVEICPKRDFFDFTAKYQEGMTDYIVPARIPEDICCGLQDMALKAHMVLGCCDLSRVDFILGEDMSYYVLEVNTIPGFTSTSLLPKAAQVKDINFDQLCLKLVELAYGKKKKAENTTLCY